ncbi:hypothetical protein BT96DRAFT_948120 [Gymnopus androsaceus JB14]|uniref:Mid2 domain-containing protein n=1 Tax=Gymnopus androsaceus JB14 TaxID=1447944 RepID=A0A6A4GR01_9AGAR|nr:hypothetical protein BT96DRAFT_948120 [Gymnopus androsaceus JB14]
MFAGTLFFIYFCLYLPRSFLNKVPPLSSSGPVQTLWGLQATTTPRSSQGSWVPSGTSSGGELVASASGFTFGVTATLSEVVLGTPTSTIVTIGEQCQATASNSGECVLDLSGSTTTTTGIANTQLVAVSKNGAFKRERYDQKLLVGLVFGTTILGIFSGGFLAL